MPIVKKHFLFLCVVLATMLSGTHAQANEVSTPEGAEKCWTDAKQDYSLCVEITRFTKTCERNKVGDFLENCDLSVNYRANNNYKGERYIKTYLECVADVTYKGRQTQEVESASELEETAMTLLPMQETEGETSLAFYFSFSDEVDWLDVSQVSCQFLPGKLW